MLHSWCSNLPLLVIAATVQLCLISTEELYDDRKLITSNDDLILLPHNPEVEDGHWLTLNCTILPHYTGEFTNRDLYFRHGNANFTNFTLVGTKTALLRLQWTMADDDIGGGHISCWLPNRTLVLSAVQHVTVVRRPLQPNVISCWLWNWTHVNCTWQPSISQQQHHMHTFVPLIQTLQWKLQDDVNNVWQDAACQGQVTESCMWNISHVVTRFMKSESCCVQLFARIHLTYLHFYVQSAPFCFRPVNNVVLPKPRNITVSDTDADRVLVQWQAPLLDRNHVSIMDLEYAVIVMSQWDDTPVINESVVNRSLSVTTVPHTMYAINVKVKTTESFLWSKPVIHNFPTAPAKPRMSPRTLTNAYTVSHVGRNTRTVIIYWQTLSLQDYCGKWLSYVVLMRKDPALHWNELHIVNSADQPCTEVIIDTKSDVELSVIARNEIGDTLPDVVMHFPAIQSSRMTTSPFSKFVVELTDDSTVVWSWQLKSTERPSGLTLFWCRSHIPLGRCVGGIHWLEIAASESEYNSSIDADNTKRFNYGVALNAENSGIEWVTCLYNVNGLAAPVQDVRVFVPSFGHPGQLLVTWVHPPCSFDYQSGYIKSLMLYYCRHAGTGCVDEPHEVSVPGYQTAYNLKGLEPGEEYAVWMYSLTRAGQSPTQSNVTIAVTSTSVMTPAIIAGVAVGVIVFLGFTVVILWLLCKKSCQRCRDKLWSPVPIRPPPPPATTHHSNEYTGVPPIVEYARITYRREVSRLSSSSCESGQFGVTSGSPILSSEAEPSFVTPHNHIEQRHQPHIDGDRPVAMTYVNDTAVFLRHPTASNHHRQSSSPDPHTELIPLQPIRTRYPNHVASDEFSTVAPADDAEDETRVTDSLMTSQQNGGHDMRQNSDYVPHEWMKCNTISG